MKDLRNVISNGEFIRTPDADRCKFCDYAAACGKATNEQAKNKQQDAKLDAYQKLIARQ